MKGVASAKLIADRLEKADAAIDGTTLARIGNPDIARLVVYLKHAAQDAAHFLRDAESRSAELGDVRVSPSDDHQKPRP